MDVIIQQDHKAGRITLNRPKALNALTYDMCLEIEKALDSWREDDGISLIIIDAEGDRAFCAGGDIAQLYATGVKGDYSYGRQFWRDEYRMNAKLAHYPKPIVSFLHGFTMGGGVGVGCHTSHRIVGESVQISMPECGIGLVPDVGGSLLLAQAPGRLGEYLSLTAARMGPEDAIYAGFADSFVEEAKWKDLKHSLAQTGDPQVIKPLTTTSSGGSLETDHEIIARNFGGERLGDIIRSLESDGSEFAGNALKKVLRNSPLSMACTIEIIHRLRGTATIETALELEYRFTHRSMEHSDLLEGIRAAIIDKDRTPKWRHDDPRTVPPVEVANMLMPLKEDALKLEKDMS